MEAAKLIFDVLENFIAYWFEKPRCALRKLENPV